MSQTCHSCKFALPNPQYSSYVFCVRYPPIQQQSSDPLSARVPVVSKDWYCGEYRSIVPVKTKAEILEDFE